MLGRKQRRWVGRGDCWRVEGWRMGRGAGIGQNGGGMMDGGEAGWREEEIRSREEGGRSTLARTCREETLMSRS
eukprot:1835289-Rhodomonas_salina.4